MMVCLKEMIGKYKIELLVFLLCLPSLLFVGNIHGGHLGYYLVDYSSGFGGRKLIGTLCSYILPFTVKKWHLTMILRFAHLILITSFAAVMGYLYRHIDRSELKWPFFSLLLIYLASPYSIRCLTSYNLGSYLEVYLVIFSCLYIFIYRKLPFGLIYCACTFALITLGCLTHHMFCCTYFILFFSLFIYDVFKKNNRRQMWRKLCCYVLYTLVLFMLCMYIMFFSQMNMPFEEFFQYLQSRTSLYFYDGQIYYEYYSSLREHLYAYILPSLKYDLGKLILTIVVHIPLLVLQLYPWWFAIKHASSNKERLMYIFMQLAFLLILPAFILAIDYMRWFIAYDFCQFALLFVMISLGDESICLAVERLVEWSRKNRYIAISAIFLVCMWYYNPFYGLQNPSINMEPNMITSILKYLGVQWHINPMVP